nr:WxL domain-containing protein [Enterococcus hirae]
MLSSTTLLGVGQAFADESVVTSADTPISAQLEVKPFDPEKDKPSVPTPDEPGKEEGDKPTDIKGLLGIAYVPKTLSTGKVQLEKAGSQSFDLSAGENVTKKFNVGVQDLTRKKSQHWSLKAQLSWAGDTNNYMAGTSITGENGAVSENKAGTLSSLNDGEVTTTATDLVIKQGSEVEVMKAVEGKTMNGVYNYQFSSPKLVIPNVENVPSGDYMGNINWNLSDVE